MHTFVAFFPSEVPLAREDYSSAEGQIRWHPLAWACDPHNRTVVSNIPLFLPAMLSTTIPLEYQCIYHGNELVTLEKHRLAPAIQADL